MQLLINMKNLIEPSSFEAEKVDKLEMISYFCMFLTGIVLGTVRTLVDPYHRFIILSGIAEWFGHIM